jgi:hypothetical protein
VHMFSYINRSRLASLLTSITGSSRHSHGAYVPLILCGIGNALSPLMLHHRVGVDQYPDIDEE